MVNSQLNYIDIRGEISNKYINKIIEFYSKNFPLQLREPLNKFRKSIRKYDYVNILCKGEEMIGFALFNWFDKIKLLHLDFISLDKSAQGSGIGSIYLKELTKMYYKITNYNALVLECENRLIKFYEKNNFVKIPSNYFYNNVRLNLMVNNKRLKLSKLKIIAQLLKNNFIKQEYLPTFFISWYE
jgi:ribosomal protein S18 acetylase RimI-like enzyme